MNAYKFRVLVRPCGAPDGDTIYCDRMDFGQGSIRMAPAGLPFGLRVVGPRGEWFDAAELRGRRARAEGKAAARIVTSMLEPVLEGGLWLACQTFPNRHPRTQDRFGRYLYHPYAVVDPERDYEQSQFDLVGTLVAAEVATLGHRFGEGRSE